MKFMPFLPLLAVLACNGTSFNGAGKSNNSSSKEKTKTQNVSSIDDKDTEQDKDDETTESDNNDESSDKKDDDKKTSAPKILCWVAISGATFGLPAQGASYMPFNGEELPTPQPAAYGDAILKPRSEPYKYKDPSGEIDGAVDGTLDNAIISPGLEVEFLSQDGQLLKSFKGPAFVTTWENHFAGGKSRQIEKFIEENYAPHRDKLPSWLRDIPQSPIPEFWTEMQATRAIRVTKTSDKKCR